MTDVLTLLWFTVQKFNGQPAVGIPMDYWGLWMLRLNQTPTQRGLSLFFKPWFSYSCHKAYQDFVKTPKVESKVYFLMSRTPVVHGIPRSKAWGSMSTNTIYLGKNEKTLCFTTSQSLSRVCNDPMDCFIYILDSSNSSSITF